MTFFHFGIAKPPRMWYNTICGLIRSQRVLYLLIRGCSSVGRAPRSQRGGHGFESHHLHQKIKDGFTLCILSGEIGGGSTEALICLGISVFGRCYDAMASDVLTVCCSLNPTVNTMSISLPSVRDHFSFFS